MAARTDLGDGCGPLAIAALSFIAAAIILFADADGSSRGDRFVAAVRSVTISDVPVLAIGFAALLLGAAVWHVRRALGDGDGGKRD